MATPKIETLIGLEEKFHLVGQQIAAILELESAGQQALAAQQGKDASDWKLRVFYESTNPIAEWLEPPEEDQGSNYDRSPIVHVSFDNDSFDKAKGNVVEKQSADGVWNIDVFGLGITALLGGSEHKPGDVEAANARNRGAAICRSILMSAHYTYLDLRGIVGRRWFASRSTFTPTNGDGSPAQHIAAMRLALEVHFVEQLTPQHQGVTLETIGLTVKRAGTGELLTYVEAEFTPQP